MQFQEIKKKEEACMMPVYGRFPAALVSGKGAVAIDVDGKRYIDFTSGIGVNALGYCDEKWADAVAVQARSIQHMSNLYYSPVQIRLAETLCRMSGYDRVFFGNSGAEANECAIKLARKYGTETRGENCNRIVTLRNSFHGRTVTTLAATGQDSFHQHFTPFTEGFSYAEPNLDSVKAAVNDSTCAVLIELIQGEGGVVPLDPAFVKGLADFCRESGVLLMADEVQTGAGRTGTLFCYENYGIRPDVITSAKGLGGGLPVGACLCTERLAGILGSGMHGSTFGGNPVVCAGALAVLERLAEPGFLEEVRAKGEYLAERLAALEGIAEVRGMGLMRGAVLEKGTAKEIASTCVRRGLLLLTAKDLLRFLPPLTITRDEIDRGLAILEEVLHRF